MDKDYLKELLATYRADKAHLWASLIVSVGGMIGLLIRAFNVKNNSLEILLIIISFPFIILLLNFIGEFNNKINYVLDKLKKGEII